MANWRKQSGVPIAKEREYGQNAISISGVTTGYDLYHTIAFAANEVKVGDIIDLFVGYEGVFSGTSNPVARINLGNSDISSTRFSSVAVATSGTRGFFFYKKLFVASPTVISVSDDAVTTGVGGSSSPILDIPVDITAGFNMTFWASMGDAGNSISLQQYLVSITR